MMTRRDLFGLAAAGALARAVPLGSAPEVARLRTRPAPATSGLLGPGRYQLRLSGIRDGLLYIPRQDHAVENTSAAALLVMLHGASNSARGVEYTFALADEFGVIILAPDSRGPTWDAVGGEFGPDVQFIDAALRFTFARCAVDPGRLAVGGFSDGASYALSLGMANGDLFSRLIAFSPGFIARRPSHGTPRIFISHGREDKILPIDVTSRMIVPQLKGQGYDVTYREFDGAHAVPPPIAHEAFQWMG